MNILAVDDDPIILELIVEVIRAMGDHEVKAVESAEAAIDFLTGNVDWPVDCFLLDIQMPKMDGIELCKLLRTSGAYPHTPVVMLTAMTDKRHIDAAFAAGANDYVTKPFEVFQLQHRIRQAEQRAILLSRQMQDFDPEVRWKRKPGLLEQVQIFDVDNLIDYFALENYVPLLSRRSLFGSVAIGFHIRHVADIHQACSARQFLGLIEDVAETISDTLRDNQFLMAYAGNGTFVAVIEEFQLPNRRALVDDVNLRLQQLGMNVPTPRGLPVRICCGEMVRLLGHKPESIESTLIVARAHAEKVGSDYERDFEDFWFHGRTAQ